MVILREGFPLIGGTNRSRHIHSILRDIIPQRSAGVCKFPVTRLHRRVRHARVKIYRPDGMSHRLVLLPHRRVILRILQVFGMIAPDTPRVLFHFLLIIIRVNAAHIDKVHRQLLISLLLCAAVQPHQRKFNLWMPGISFRSLLDKMTVNVIRHVTHDLQKF